MNILAVGAISIALSLCGDTVQFKEGEYKKGQIVWQVVAKMPTTDCWQSWRGDTTLKFATVRGNDSAGTFVIVARTKDSIWVDGDVTRDGQRNISDLSRTIQKFKKWLGWE